MTRAVAGAPISWGVCEVPGWGHQMGPSRVLDEMSGLGLTATELGPDGFLPADPSHLSDLLSDHGLRLVGGFLPIVLHDHARWMADLADVERRLGTLAAAGASMVVVAAATGSDGYETTPAPAAAEWRELARTVAELERMSGEVGMRVSVHPHHGTVIETPSAIATFLDVSDAALCLDTGHVLVGGGNPVALARQAADRISHVHVKDVDASIAARVRDGSLGYHQAVRAGMYRPLGAGDVDIAAVLTALDRSGYDGWYVLEQDITLVDEPPPGGGPVLDVAASLRFLTDVPTPAGAGGTGASAPTNGKRGTR